ncbi:hypothetical protein WZ78_09525 [Leuconostoc mesenteroides subsp. dextranicum]|jgi:hypothetical protein|uniref:hypothetical protein n=1 Tax=Leuconostoc mesenteroides TaxID=1245 RepID=UPI0006803D11|nr:hypothetical protein [Leuconostoc mesenteroides]KMY80381.1 hypothetical protein WZ78_09525 [Leuconostoc mesenteroides subsp. dextranicum]MBZ1503362.1 hypothetical protein [Leuconostoc mesenteroides]RDF87510.1 hypothetical protein DQM10_09665 [Leuconostoc mesenteroides subsp. mesenteroides]
MSLSNLEKQQQKLNKLNEKIKNEKEKIDKKLGHEIIKISNFDYSNLDQNKIKDISKQVADFLNSSSVSDNDENTSKENDSNSSTNVSDNKNGIS